MAASLRLTEYPAGALIRREFLSEMRRPRLLVFVALAGIAAIGAVLVDWPDSSYNLRYASYFAIRFFRTFASIMMAVAICALPAMSAGSIVSERERETHELLRMSLISSGGYVFAKTVNALGHLFALLIGFAPLVAIVFFLAGIGMQQVQMMFAMLCAFSIMVTAISLFCSACARRTLPAVVMSYAGVLVVMTFPVVLYFLGLAFAIAIGVPVRSLRGALEPVYHSLMPIAAYDDIVTGELTGLGAALPMSMPLIWAAVFLALTVMRVHRPLPPQKIDTSESIDDPAVLASRRRSFPFYLIDPLKRRPAIEDDRNPMLVREMRWGAMTRGSTLVRLFYTSFVVYFFGSAIVVVLGDITNDIRSWVVVQMAITLAIAPAMLANAFTRERELGNMDMLRMTLMDPGEIVAGKFFTGMIAVAPLLIAATVSAAFPVILGVRDFAVLATGYLSLVAATVLALSVSIAASLVAHRTAGAIGIAYAATLFVSIGFALSLQFAVPMFLPEDSSAQASSVLDPLRSVARFPSPIFGYLDGVPRDWRTRSYEINFGYWGGNVAATLLTALAVARGTVWYFRKFRMQDR